MMAIARTVELGAKLVPGEDADDDADGLRKNATRMRSEFMGGEHDIDDEAMGPTRFWPETHAPRCFPGRTSSSTTSSLACLPSVYLLPDERWLPPTEARVAQRPPSCWFALSAGDAVLMDSLTWHCGGTNSSGRRRTLLSASFVEPTPGRLGSGAAATTPRLGDFV